MIMNNEAFRTYSLLKRKPQSKEVIESLQEFSEYLRSLCNQICPKGLKDSFIYQWTFKHVISSEKDYENYCKANLFAANNSLHRIISKFAEEKINDFKNKLLTDFICDLKPFIEYFDRNQDYSWLIMNTNVHITNFYYDLSINVFFKGMPGKHPEQKLVLASSTPFIIRQCIEYKLKRILGIDYWLIDGKPDIRAASKCFTAIDNNKAYYKTRNFSFQIIKTIHSWTNPYIHGGYRPEPWKTETAINYLNNLFYAGKTTSKNLYSLYASIEVQERDLPKIRESTEMSIRNESRGNIEIEWRLQPEVAIIRK